MFCLNNDNLQDAGYEKEEAKLQIACVGLKADFGRLKSCVENRSPPVGITTCNCNNRRAVAKRR